MILLISYNLPTRFSRKRVKFHRSAYERYQNWKISYILKRRNKLWNKRMAYILKIKGLKSSFN